MRASKIKEPVVAAIDIGTTYSGYAFSFKYDYKKVYSECWSNGANAQTTKTPTVLLLHPDQKFHSFGYDAEAAYADLVSNGKHLGWWYFRRFKMELESEKRKKHQRTIDKNLTVEDNQGRQLKAVVVFKHSIRFLKDAAYEKMRNSLPDLKLTDIRWVITVPAIWDNRAKEFMAIAADMAGISRDKLVLAYEPEAAAVFCRDVAVSTNTEGAGNIDLQTFEPGSQFLVLDLGGGTVDITALNVNKDDSMDSLSPPTGGPWGGTVVDDQFHDFLKKIFGQYIFDKWYAEEKEDALDLDKAFEIKKRTIKPGEKQPDGTPGVVYLKVSESIFKMMKEIRKIEDLDEYLETTKYAGKVCRVRDKLGFPSELCVEMFRKSKSKLLDHLRKIMLGLPDIETILMVGGLSESIIIQDAVKVEFPNHKVVVPQEAGIAIAKGAVIYGHLTNVIRSRVVPFTYGVSTSRPFREGTDPPSKKHITRKGEIRCEDVFDSLVTIGEVINTQKTHSKEFYAIASESTTIEIYRSTSVEPAFVTDPGCELEAALKIFIGSSCATVDERVLVKVEISFGSTEITVKAGESKKGSMPWKTTLSFI